MAILRIETVKRKSLDPNLLNPNQDSRFYKPRTIFLAKGYALARGLHGEYVPGIGYEESDRLGQFYSKEDRDRAEAEAKTLKLPQNSAVYFEAWLRSLTKDPGLRLIHIAVRCRPDNGQTHRLYGFIGSLAKSTDPPQP